MEGINREVETLEGIGGGPRVPGRVRSDTHPEGYILDRGFQIKAFLTGKGPPPSGGGGAAQQPARGQPESDPHQMLDPPPPSPGGLSKEGPAADLPQRLSRGPARPRL